MFHDDLVRFRDGREVDLLVPGDQLFRVFVEAVQRGVVEVHSVRCRGRF